MPESGSRQGQTQVLWKTGMSFLWPCNKMAFNLKMELGWSDRFPVLLRGTKVTILTRGLGSLLCAHSRQIIPQRGRRKARLAPEALKQLPGVITVSNRRRMEKMGLPRVLNKMQDNWFIWISDQWGILKSINAPLYWKDILKLKLLFTWTPSLGGLLYLYLQDLVNFNLKNKNKIEQPQTLHIKNATLEWRVLFGNFNFFLSLLVCMMSVGGTCHGMCLEVRGQLWGVGSFLLIFVWALSGDRTQAMRLVRQAPSPAESHAVSRGSAILKKALGIFTLGFSNPKWPALNTCSCKQC